MYELDFAFYQSSFFDGGSFDPPATDSGGTGSTMGDKILESDLIGLPEGTNVRVITFVGFDEFGHEERQPLVQILLPDTTRWIRLDDWMEARGIFLVTGESENLQIGNHVRQG